MSGKKLLAGYGRKEITPPVPMPLAGYGNTMKRISQGCLDGLFATCVAFTDEKGETLLVCTADTVVITEEVIARARQSITAATGVPGDHVFAAGTHSHSTPDIYSEYDNNMSTWKQCLCDGLTAAAQAAMEDRAPTRIWLGSTYTERLNFVRHYIQENGAYVGDNFGDYKASPIADYASPADNQVQMVRLEREGAKDILMVNWQAHAKLASTASTENGRATRPFMSADYIAPCRDYVEEQTGAHFAFYLGAAGNLNPISEIKSHMRTTEYREYGRLLGQTIVEGLDKLQPAENGEVAVRGTVFQAQPDHTEDHMIEDARKIDELWKQTNNFRQCAEAGRPYGIISPYHAGAIIARYNSTETVRKMELCAGCIGPLGFVTAPYEMFDTNGRFVKENSPCRMTFVMTCANGHHNYIASDLAFEYGSYEVHNRDLVRGTAEALVDTMVNMLVDIKNSEK